ncbi:MAG: hypothetical protein PVH37_07935 [Desulfobacterales bacterium]|jgi:ribosome-associated toxin RatA of RatAB toxin-antitoxin module
MNKRLLFITVLALLWVAGICLAGEVPHQISVFVLNRDIADFKDYVIMESALPIRYMENIEEVEIKSIKGLKTGYIAYATCAAPGHIVRIKLKYKDSSKKFFKDLLKQIEKKYGEPDEYRGDPFHILIAWKWSFIDKEGNRISLNLQHNFQDPNQKMGNAIKLTMWNLVEEDQQCYRRKADDPREKLRQRNGKVLDSGLSGWDLYLPR